jgi:hypothetical protein
MYNKAEFTIKKRTWVILIVVSLLLWFVIAGIVNLIGKAADNYGTQRVEHYYTIVGEDMREPVRCEFEKPLKYVNLIVHWYDTNEEMFADYITLADDPSHDEIWGWSSCVWQPHDDWAACDIFVVKPDFVHADMNIDTLGHEVLHGACGGFHE